MRPSFNSIYNKAVAETQTQFPLQQHFIGWFIKSDEAFLIPHELLSWIFSCAKETLVLCTCCLHLPTEALLEYTLFSHDDLMKAEYETAIKEYIAQLGITNYSITEKNKEASQ
jgi:lycopene beta-cyclase